MTIVLRNSTLKNPSAIFNEQRILNEYEQYTWYRIVKKDACFINNTHIFNVSLDFLRTTNIQHIFLQFKRYSKRGSFDLSWVLVNIPGD